MPSPARPAPVRRMNLRPNARLGPVPLAAVAAGLLNQPPKSFVVVEVAPNL